MHLFRPENDLINIELLLCNFQRIVLNKDDIKYSSASLALSNGVPQESLLVTFSNNIFSCSSNNNRIILYANDTAVVSLAECNEVTREHTNTVDDTITTYCLILNQDKTNLICFSTKDLNKSLLVKFNNKTIEQKMVIKYFGISARFCSKNVSTQYLVAIESNG